MWKLEPLTTRRSAAQHEARRRKLEGRQWRERADDRRPIAFGKYEDLSGLDPKAIEAKVAEEEARLQKAGWRGKAMRLALIRIREFVIDTMKAGKLKRCGYQHEREIAKQVLISKPKEEPRYRTDVLGTVKGAPCGGKLRRQGRNGLLTCQACGRIASAA